MKIITIILLLISLPLNGWPSYVALLHNPSSLHTVALLGDVHESPHSLQKERAFIQGMKPYLNYLITPNLPFNAFILESNITVAYDYLPAGLQYPPQDLSLLELLILLTFTPLQLKTPFINQTRIATMYNTIRTFLGIFPTASITIIPADNRDEALRVLTGLLQSDLDDAATVHFEKFKQSHPHLALFNQGIKWIDALFFNNSYHKTLLENGLDDAAIEDLKNTFIMRAKSLFKKAYLDPEESLENLISIIEKYLEFLRSFNLTIVQNLPLSQQQPFLKLEKELLFAKKQLMMLSHYAPTLFQSIFNLALHLKSFSDLIHTFQFMDNYTANPHMPTFNTTETITLHHANFYLTTSLGDIGFFKTIWEQQALSNNCFVFTGKGHSINLVSLLTALGYEIKFLKNSLPPQPLDNGILSDFINQYFDYCSKKAMTMPSASQNNP